MLTQSDLEARGWVFEPPLATGPAHTELVPVEQANGEVIFHEVIRQAQVSTTADQCPLFFLIRGAGHLEGDHDLMDQPVTPALVAQTSGEPYDNTAELAAQQAAQQAAAAAALVQFRMLRDRLLAQTDYIEVFIANPAGFSPLPQAIQDAINANSPGWTSWRQALRDMPAQPGFNAATALGAQPHVSTQAPWPAAWPQPPAAPVIHFT